MHEPKSVCISGVGAQPDTTLPAKGNPDPGTPVGEVGDAAGRLLRLNMGSLGSRATCWFWVGLQGPLGLRWWVDQAMGHLRPEDASLGNRNLERGWGIVEFNAFGISIMQTYTNIRPVSTALWPRA